MYHTCFQFIFQFKIMESTAPSATVSDEISCPSECHFSLFVCQFVTHAAAGPVLYNLVAASARDHVSIDVLPSLDMTIHKRSQTSLMHGPGALLWISLLDVQLTSVAAFEVAR